MEVKVPNTNVSTVFEYATLNELEIIKDLITDGPIMNQLCADFAPIRDQVQKAVDSAPNSITLEQALEQQKLFDKAK